MEFKQLTRTTIKDRDEWTDKFFSQIVVDEEEETSKRKESIYIEEKAPVEEPPREIPKEESLNPFGDKENESKKSFAVFAILIVLMVLIAFLCGMLVSKIVNNSISNNRNTESTSYQSE